MRALVLSDIHANLEALRAVLQATAGRFDTLWNLGDTVGYGGSPNQVIEMIRPIAAVNVRGNHDRVCAGLSSAVNFNPVARLAAMWTRSELSAENLLWLQAVPQGPVSPAALDHQAGEQEPPPSVACAHGSPLDEDKYILNLRDAWAPLQQMETAITFFGHTHIQGGFMQHGAKWQEVRPRFRSRNDVEMRTLSLVAGTRHLINPGSVGQPRDADWRAAFLIYDSDAGEIEFYRVPYDLTASQGRILMAGLPERLAARLREGR